MKKPMQNSKPINEYKYWCEKEILISDKDFTDTDYGTLKKALDYIEKKKILSDGNMYLTVDVVTKINNIITGSNFITQSKVNVKPYGYDKKDTDKSLREYNLHEKINQFNDMKITSIKLMYRNLLNF